MIITDSTVAMNARHQLDMSRSEQESLEIRRGGAEGGPGQDGPRGVAGVSLTLSQASQSIRHIELETTSLEGADDGVRAQAQFEVSLLKLIVEHFTGRRIKLFDPADLEPKEAGEGQAAAASGQAGSPGQGERLGLRYSYHAVREERESTRFTATGVARTADGREIDFSVALNMSREFREEVQFEVRAGAALEDPLVLNFEGNAAQLTQRDFSFDLDLDGQEDQIAFVSPDSGFLALDRNGDGAIGDGSELFGPTTGDGFAELAEFDADANDWIDENDPVYARLRIWSRDAAGNEQLAGLGARGVGAIYLGNTATPFALQDADGAQLGAVRSSGVFLAESGEVGTVQQVDLVV